MGSPKRLRTYKEMAQVIDDLPIILREARRKHRLNQADMAEQLGLSPSGYRTIENTGNCTSQTLTRILRWL